MRYFISVISIIFIFSSCKNDLDNSLIVYKTAEEGLQRSNKNITYATNLVYHALDEKAQDPQTREVAIRWQPIIGEIKKLSDSIVKYISGLKEELKNEAGGNDPKNKNWETSSGVSEHLFESHGKGKELLEALVKYKEALLILDPKVKNQFEHTVNVFSSEFTFAAADSIAFTKTFFSNMPVIAANVVLSKFVNNVKICENEIVTYCYNQIGHLDGESMFRKFSFIAGLSSTYLKAGDELEITAGVGAFSDAGKPRISVNNIAIPLNENAVAIYKLKTSLKAGKYFVPVKIEYITEDGRKELITKTLSYTVVE